MTDLEPSGFSHIDHLLQLVGRTRELLDAVVSEGGLPAGGADYLADTTLPHLEGVEAGSTARCAPSMRVCPSCATCSSRWVPCA